MCIFCFIDSFSADSAPVDSLVEMFVQLFDKNLIFRQSQFRVLVEQGIGCIAGNS